MESLLRGAMVVFVAQLVTRATEADVFQFFQQAGEVRKVVLVRDRSGRSKGLAYVEYASLDGARAALELDGKPFPVGGFPVKVQPSGIDKQAAAAAEAEGGTAFDDSAGRQLYLCNLPLDLPAADLELLAQQFGRVEKVQIVSTPSGTSRGFAAVRYYNASSVQTASEALYGIQLGGKDIRVGTITTTGQVCDSKGDTWDLEPMADGRLTAAARAAIAAHAMAQVTGKSVEEQEANAPRPGEVKPSNVGSRFLLLSNLFDPSTETSPNWIAEVAEDVRTEVSKLVPVQRVLVHPTRPAGLVYLATDSHGSALAAAAALHGRTFAARSVQCQSIPELQWHAAVRDLEGLQGGEPAQPPAVDDDSADSR